MPYDIQILVWKYYIFMKLIIYRNDEKINCFQCVKFHPNSNYIATGSNDRFIRLWDILNGNCVRLFSGHKVLELPPATPDHKHTSWWRLAGINA